MKEKLIIGSVEIDDSYLNNMELHLNDLKLKENKLASKPDHVKLSELWKADYKFLNETIFLTDYIFKTLKTKHRQHNLRHN